MPSRPHIRPLATALHAAVCTLAALLLMPITTSQPASAQSCTTDAQCGPSAGGYNRCLGDTLILTRRICLAGQCLQQEMGRTNCNIGGGAGVCRGNVFVRSGGRCDALAGRCTSGGAIQIACVKTCSCRGNRLTISTGTCIAGRGCGRAAFRCRKGCTCQPEPRCLEDPEPALKKPRPARRPPANN